MNEDRLIDLWLRRAGGERLSEAEERELVEALEKDADLRARLLKNDQIDGLMRTLGPDAKEAELFEKSFLERLSAEQDATRFIRKVESRFEREDLPKPPGSPGGPGRREGTPQTRRPPTRRTSRFKGGSRAPGSSGPLLLAAAVLFGIILLFTLTSTSPSSPGPANVAESRARALKEAEAVRREAEARLRANEEKRKLLAQTQVPPTESVEAKEKRQKELARLRIDLEQIEREIEEAVARGKTAQDAPPQKDAPSPPPQDPPAVKLEGMTQAAIAQIDEASGEAFLVTKDGKVPATPQASVLSIHGLETGGGASRILLRFTDGTRLEIGSDTLVSRISSEKGKQLTVDRGSEIRAVVAKQPKGEPMIFVTPQSVITVVGTTLRILVNPDPKKGTRLEVEEGKVEIKNLLDKTILVDSGHYAVAAAGAEFEKKPLPTPAQRLLTEKGEVTINFGPEGVALPANVLNDSGEEFDLKRGYGWKGPKTGPKIQGASWLGADGRRQPVFAGRYASLVREAPDLLRGTAVIGGWANHVETWRLSVPNGRYLVSVMAGYTDQEGWEQGPHHVRVQGKLVVDAVMTRKGSPAFREAVPVDVKDGELTLAIGGHLTTKTGESEVSSTRLNFVVVKKTPN